MVDIFSKLVPNLQTLITQLIATFIIFLLYRKFLHQPVLNFLDKQKDNLRKAELHVEAVEKEAEEREQALNQEREEAMASLERMRNNSRQEINEERERLLREARVESERLTAQAEERIEKTKEEMMKDIEDYALELAVSVNQRVLSDIDVSEEETLSSLQKEMDRVINGGK